jgi:hypothetical protein
VRFSIDQVIGLPRRAVEDAFSNPAFYEALGSMDGLGPPQVLERRADPACPYLVYLKVRYTFIGNLSAPVLAVIDPSKATWVDHSTMDRLSHQVEFDLVPEHYPDRLRCRGRYRLEPDPVDPLVTHQLMEGELMVAYPFLGPLVERVIALGFRQHLGQEATILESWSKSRAVPK